MKQNSPNMFNHFSIEIIYVINSITTLNNNLNNVYCYKLSKIKKNKTIQNSKFARHVLNIWVFSFFLLILMLMKTYKYKTPKTILIILTMY